MFDFLKPKKESTAIGHSAEHTSNIQANVGQTVYAVVYDENRKPVQVPMSDVNYWLSKGFTNAPSDPVNTLKELLLTIDEVRKLVQTFYNGCVDDGKVDSGDESNLATANYSIQSALSLWNELVNTLYAIYPKAEPDPVLMTNSAGQEFRVDPAQVNHYANAFGLRVK